MTDVNAETLTQEQCKCKGGLNGYDFIVPLGLTRYKVAKLAGVQQRRIDEICARQRNVTADTALRLACLFGTEAAFWMNLQAQFDLEITERGMYQRIKDEVTPLAMAA